MFELPLHPALVHIPLGLVFVMPFLILLFWFFIHKGWLPKKVWIIAIICQIMVFGSGLIAMETGEHDEEIVEKVVPENIIETHEEKAETFVWISGFITLLLFSLIAAPDRFSNLSKVVSLIAVLINLILAMDLGHSGGELVYKHNAASAHINSSTYLTPNKAKTSDDDDD